MSLSRYFWTVVACAAVLLLNRLWLPPGRLQSFVGLAVLFYLLALVTWANFNSRRVWSPWGNPPEEPPRKSDR